MGLVAPGDSSSSSSTNSKIIDIRSDATGIEIKQEIIRGLHPKNGDKRTLPTLLLYDERGLRLFEDITYLEQYYLTNQEISLLQNYADCLAERIPQNALLVELGSGYAQRLCQT